MRYRHLGASGLCVSVVALGSMPFGSQVGEPLAHRILDRAWHAGINFFDTAEMYASPPTAESYGLSESIIGRWIRTKPRDSVLIATKIAGPNDGAFGPIVPHIRGGSGTLDRHHLRRAVEGSLQRLGTDYIDLYQIHWPDRGTPIELQLDGMERLIDSGQVRYFGTSNETPWGLTRLSMCAKQRGGPHPVSVQNGYNLLERGFEAGLQEVCLEERIGMIAYSPLAMGLLSGKYRDGARPAGARLTVFERYRERYRTPELLQRGARFAAMADAAGIEPAQMAMAWVRDRPAIASVLSSCTGEAQVDGLVKAADLTLPRDLLDELEYPDRQSAPPGRRARGQT